MSLRLRFVLLPVLVVIAGLISLAALAAWDARARVRAETEANVQLGRVLAASAITHAGRAATPPEAIADLRRELPPLVRDLELTVEQGGGASAPSTRNPARGAAPDWFERLVGAPAVVERYPIFVAGSQVGSVALRSSQDKAILAAWENWRRQVAAIALMSAIVILAILVAGAWALRPIAAFARVFDRQASGELSVRPKSSSIRELRSLAERFNRLAIALEKAKTEGSEAVDEAALARAAERKHIAQELQDGYGPPLFAIRSDLGALSRWVRKREPRFEEIEERLLSISGLVAQIQRINSQLLDRLRR